MRGFTAALIVLCAISATETGAQEKTPFEVGDILRITAPDRGVEEQVARYLRLYRDTLTVMADSELVFPIASLTRLDVSQGLRSKPTLIGMAVGAFAGVVVGIAIASEEESGIMAGPTDPTTVTNVNRPARTSGGSGSLGGAAVGPVAGALIGAFVGGLVGKAFRRHLWENVPLNALGVIVQRGRCGMVSLGMSVRL